MPAGMEFYAISMCAFESVNYPPNEIESFVDNLLYFPPFKCFPP